MSSATTNTTSHHQIAKDQTSAKSLTKITKSKTSKKVSLHQPMPPSPPDDWVLFPQDVVAEKHSSIRPARTDKSAKSASSPRQTMSSPVSHVMACEAARPNSRRSPEPYKPSTCLHHLSARNCTDACTDNRLLSKIQRPPKAPSLPRLPTPDLSDIGEDDLWSCCRSFKSSESDSSTQDKDFWNEMDETLIQAMRYQRAKRLE